MNASTFAAKADFSLSILEISSLSVDRNFSSLLVSDESLSYFSSFSIFSPLICLSFPVASIALHPAALIARMTRSSMLEVLSHDMIRTATSKGLFRSRIFFVHALRNAINKITHSDQAIIIDGKKITSLSPLKQLEVEFDEIFWLGNSFEDLYETFNHNQNDPKSKIFCSAMEEWKKSKKSRSQMNSNYINSLKERMNRSMLVTFNKESELIEKNLTFLATAGSTAPFVGLFGTVWGIMNSFQSIAIAQNTNLAVVAPGIAEALFATALGLFVAIPAVVAYNKITSDLSKYFISLETFIDEFTTIFFRQLEDK